MKNAFAIVTLSALVSACAVVPPEPAPAEPVTPAVAPPTPAADATAKAAPPDAKLPNVELTSDLFYKLTKAELDFKRGQWQSAYVTMMVLAQQTRDARLARRASEMALSAKQGNEALAAIRLWRELAPESDEAAQYFLGFAVLGDDLGEAENLFAQRPNAAPPVRMRSLSCTIAAVDGKIRSGVAVATMMRSTSSGFMAAAPIASRAACTARSDVVSPSAAM